MPRRIPGILSGLDIAAVLLGQLDNDPDRAADSPKQLISSSLTA